MKKITEKEFVRQIATQNGMTIKASNIFLQAFKDVVKDNLRNKAATHMIGFGTFETFTRHKRIGYNPKTKKQLILPEITVAKFRTGYGLKKAAKG